MFNKKRVFVSCSGETGRHIALGLKETLLSHTTLDVFVESIPLGDQWFETLRQKLGEADYGIACLTPGSSVMPWINFEVGFGFGKRDNFMLLLFGDDLVGPLKNIQAENAKDPAKLVALLERLLEMSTVQAQQWFEFHRATWEAKLARLEQPTFGRLDEALGKLMGGGLALRENAALRHNECFQEVVLYSIGDTAARLSRVIDDYAVPAYRYPEYLIQLQEQRSATVKAVALIDHQEYFWQQPPGRRILQSSQSSSERVFVFTKPQQLYEHFDTLTRHAQRYAIWVMSLAELNRSFPGFDHDFSIIKVGQGAVLAHYVQSGDSKLIRFATERNQIDTYERIFGRIASPSAAFRLSSIVSGPEEVDRAVFPQGATLTPMENRYVEMSIYIPIADYDAHEEEHAYYVAMMERMVSLFEKAIPATLAGRRVFELGAGTGIFTKRLAGLLNVDMTVLEIDWLCFNFMKEKLALDLPEDVFRRITFWNKDSRNFDAPGVFDGVFSSFADHHIKQADKEAYFQNVRRNMKPGSVFVVGDEFLPEYDTTSKEAREHALKLYHGHIIDIARSKNQTVLVELESAALRSGIDNVGDFKLSLSQYEGFLSRAGFQFVREKVGPLDRDDVGGIYVYVARLSA